MNSTERLLAVLNGKMPDRVPISTYELIGWNARNFENRQPSYSSLMDFIRARTDCIYMTGVHVPNKLDQPPEVEKWDEDEQHVERLTLQTPTRRLVKIVSSSDNVMTTWTRTPWCGDLDDLWAMLSMPFELGQPDYSALEDAWADLQGTRGLPMIDLMDPLCEVAEKFEFGQFTVLAMTETQQIIKALDFLHERKVAKLERVLKGGGPVRSAMWRIVGPEYAAPPFLPPELFSKLVVPYVSRYVEMIRQAGGYPRIHIHGRIGRLLNDILRMNPSAIDPVEPRPDGDADVGEVKAALGDQICLMGGIELKHIESASEEFVADLTRRTLAEGKDGGRFVIMPTAAPIDVPLSPQTERNYRVFIETALEAGRY
ncbi:MAG: uroporphyrinogen decarboxylase family protein [Phycisphaerae bacterium]|jgi:hypothetical protein